MPVKITDATEDCERAGDALVAIAKQLQLDVERFEADRISGATKRKVRADISAGKVR